MTQPDLFEQAQRDRVLTRTEARYGRYLALLRGELARTSRDHGAVSADDARRFMAAHPELGWPAGNNWLGALFRVPGWRCVGTTLSRTPGSHANLLRTWVWEG